MSLRHAVLGLLAIEPSTGYELTRRFDLSLRTAWHASHSQVYPELAKLQEEGMAEVIGEGARRSRTWAVTDAGRAELHRWLTQTEPSRSQRSETGLRWFLVFLLGPEERRAVFERELEFVTREAQGRRELAAELDASGRGGPFRPLLVFAERSDEVMVNWIREEIAKTYD
jgi:PadR family transcriptional regulator AphA